MLLMLYLDGIDDRWHMCAKKVVIQKPRFSKLKFEGDCKVSPMCMISAIKAKRLLHKGCEVYLAYVVVKSSPKVTLGSTSEVQELIWSQVLDLKKS